MPNRVHGIRKSKTTVNNQKATTNNASALHSNSSVSEKCRQASVVDVESEVCYEEHRLGGFTLGILSSRARGAGDTGPALLGFLCGSLALSCRSFLARSGRFAICSLALRLALMGYLSWMITSTYALY